MRRRIAAIVMVASVVGLGLFAGACVIGLGGGGGNELTLKDYFKQLEALRTKLDTDAGEVGTRLSSTQDVNKAGDIFAEFVGVLDAFVSGVEDLNPPDEAQKAHDTAVERGKTFVDEFQNAADEAQKAKTVEELTAATSSDGLTSADKDFTTSCNKLQGIADDNKITVDLGCKG